MQKVAPFIQLFRYDLDGKDHDSFERVTVNTKCIHLVEWHEDWDFVAHRQGAAAVVAVDEEGKLLMVRQWRNALDREALELPAGARDFPEEEMELCARRELEEETGFKAGKMKRLLSLRSGSGHWR